MDQSLRALCDALKKIIVQLNPQHNAVSFLLLTGKGHQGKTTLLRQSQYEHMVIHSERGADIYYNQHSVILELGEAWLNQSKNILQYTLKQLNSCHRTVKIGGIVLCVDINELFMSEPIEYTAQSKKHAQFIERFGQSLGYRVPAAIMFTKLDLLAGFCDFFQHDHAIELTKPLGFSLHEIGGSGKLADVYRRQFDHFIEVLGQQVVNKIHSARSSIKRTLIREFPLQLASLRAAIQSLILNISPQLFSLDALYFTSAEQGGISSDRLNKKIQHEYGLIIQDQFPQSTNYQAYFIEGALQALHNKIKRHAPVERLSHKWMAGGLASAVAVSLLFITYQYLNSVQLLDDASKELLTYDALSGQKNKQTSALYHLANASHRLDKLASDNAMLPVMQKLKQQVGLDTKHSLTGYFLPELLADIENTITDSQQSQYARYQALKIYLTLADANRLAKPTAQTDIEAWFQNHWLALPKNERLKKISLLQQTLRQPMQALTINRQIANDARNYLNALPATYLYYSLAKQHFSQKTTPLNIDNFDLASNSLPEYFTKAGFQTVIANLPTIAAQLQADNWVLARQDLVDLPNMLQKAYCYDYAVWWQNFMSHSAPKHTQDYQKARELAHSMYQSQAIPKLVDLIQQQTSPESGENASLFNQEIASKFTELSLISHSSMRNLTLSLNELEQFLATLSIVNDQGKTAFTLTKARFEGDTLINPLSALYNNAKQFPAPVSIWAKQIADDTWFTLISDCKNYINQQWQQSVLHDYQDSIAQRYPFNTSGQQDIAIADFDRFFASHGVLNNFIDQYLKPFLDTSQPQWTLKETNNYVLPISSDVLNELIRANIVTNMFFPNQSETSKIDFSLQKLSLDPIVGSLHLSIGERSLVDTQTSDSFTQFGWPEMNAKLTLNSIEGNQYDLEETGPWAFFKMLQKVNVLVDEQDTASLQILFEVNGNSGRYLLKTENAVNAFIPGILAGFALPERIV